ncbi:MAG: hypothetical protein OEM27_06965 [Nitrospinota bacterium]|nr:hypothetical protein [Nitrospinota bacterium]
MVIDGLSSKEIKELREKQARRPSRTRKTRSTILSDKTTKKAFKKFDQDHEPDANINDNVSIDEHVKMNDSYMRTGWYVPKKK